MSKAQDPKENINKKTLEAILILYKPKAEIAEALRLFFLEDYTLQAAGESCSMTRQGFFRYVKKVRQMNEELQESLSVLKGKK
jgi:predicted DNA-binding protein YlxM (UPF0122 family)